MTVSTIHRQLAVIVLCLAVVAVCTASAWAQDRDDGPDGNVPGVLPGTVTADEAAENGDGFRPDLNTSVTAEMAFRVARNLAASGGYAEASRRLDELVAGHPRVVLASADDPHLAVPLWRAVAEEVLSWPADGVREYQQAVAATADAAVERALRSGDLAELEGVAQRYFLSDSGDDAAIILADRLRERGWAALALHYYLLVLHHHPSPSLSSDALALRAALSAREAGAERVVEALSDTLDRAVAPLPAGEASRPAADWLTSIASREPLPETASSGYGNLSGAESVVPATMVWRIPIASQPQRNVVRGRGSGHAATPSPIPTLAEDRIFVANVYSVWAIDSRSGRVLWRYDTRGAEGEELPPAMDSPSCQPAVKDGTVYVALERPSENNNQQRFQPFGRGGSMQTGLFALDADTGRPRWKWNPQQAGLDYANLAPQGQPIVTGNRLLVPLGSPGNFFGEIHTAALDRETGELLWAQGLAGFSADLTQGRQPWRGQTESAGTGLVHRSGLLLSSGMGVTSAQSMLSGRILWSRTLADMERLSAEGAGPRTIGGMTLARLPRLIAHDGVAIGAFVLAPNVEAYDWLSGDLVWRTPAAGAPQAVGLTGDRVVTWGRAVMAFDLADGRPVWDPQVPPEPISGEPVIGRTHVVVPTTDGIATIAIDSGRLETGTVLPPQVATGNLGLADSGLIVTSQTGIAALQDWATARRQLLDVADERPADPSPLVTLAAAALRLDKVRDGLGYLDRASDREPSGELRMRVYDLYEDFYRRSILRMDDAFVERVLDRMRSTAATDAHSLCRQAFLRAEHFARRDPRQAAAALQHILDDDATRHLRIKGPVGPGVSGILAEQAIARLIGRDGRGVYAPWDQRAAAAHRQALAAGDYDRLLEVAQRYPNSPAAAEALDDALALTLRQGRPGEAHRLLERLTNLAPDGGRAVRYRALLVGTSLELGMRDFAWLQAKGLADEAQASDTVELAGSPTTVGRLIARAHPAEPETANADTPQRRAIPAPPYRKVWETQVDERFAPVMVEPPAGDDIPETFVMTVRNEIVAVDRQDGRVLWRQEPDAGQRIVQNRAHLGRSGLYVCQTGHVSRLDLRTGRPLWRVALEPERQRRVFAPHGSVTGVLRYGDSGWQTGSNAVPTRFIELGGMPVFSSIFNVHMLDPRDGYSVETIGYPWGTFHGGFICYDEHVMGIPLRPPAMRNLALAWSIVTGDLVREMRFDHQVAPSTLNPHGSRHWPVFIQETGRVHLIDLATAELGRGIEMELPKQQHQAHRSGLAHDGVLYMTPQQGPIKAVRFADNETLWTFGDESTRFTKMEIVGDRLLACWPQGMVALGLGDGTVRWEENFGENANISLARVGPKRLVAMIREREDRRFTVKQVIYDHATGEPLATLREGPSAAMILYSDREGLLVRWPRQHRLEYWVTDPEGTLPPE